MAAFRGWACLPFCIMAALSHIGSAARAGNPVPAADVSFEGDYLVGKTACTVTPVKMAFRVQCGRHKAGELYFFEGQAGHGGPAYSAARGKPRKPRYVFEDESIERGIFIDRQGKRFRVIRKRD
jgi:hypothetical protein